MIAARAEYLSYALPRDARAGPQCMKIAIRMMIGIGTPRSHSSIERIMGLRIGV
jgi:hypothetical protein